MIMRYNWIFPLKWTLLTTSVERFFFFGMIDSYSSDLL